MNILCNVKIDQIDIAFLICRLIVLTLNKNALYNFFGMYYFGNRKGSQDISVSYYGLDFKTMLYFMLSFIRMVLFRNMKTSQPGMHIIENMYI